MTETTVDALEALTAEIAGCRACAAALPHAPRPVLRVSATARLLIIGQAPGARVHASGIPWDDASGERLRAWLALDRERFYDVSRIAIVPMGLCFPGTDAKGGDRPPRPECAPLWHPRLLPLLPAVRLTLLVGGYAQRRYLGPPARSGVTATVAAWRTAPPNLFPLPHPSWRNTAWLNRHPWFEAELLPELRRRVAEVLEG